MDWSRLAVRPEVNGARGDAAWKMVATRRGVRVSSPAKSEPEPAAEVQATPSGRRTRRAVKLAESPTRHQPVEACSQLEKNEEGNVLNSPRRRCTRASRLHSPEQPSTPVDSTHETDVSDMESCCSTASNSEPPATRSTRSRRRKPRVAQQQDEEVSEVESCSSAVSASKHPQSSRRSTRRKTVPESSDAEKGDVKAEESQRVTRSQRKTTRSTTKQQTEDSELSDAESCTSSVSGAEVSKSTTRRSTRSRRPPRPIPMHLDEPSDSSQSSAPTGRRTRSARGKAAEDGSEPQSDGFESGPTYSVATRRRSKAAGLKAVDSDSEVTDVHSPVGSPTRGRGTPCSSRTGSGNSSRGAPTSRRSVRDITAVKENVEEPTEEDDSLNDSKLENTLITEDADCTLVEEEKSQIKSEESKVAVVEVEKEASDSPVCPYEAVKEPAVITEDQQEEPSAEKEAGDTSEMERMQETAPSSEPVEPSVTAGEKASETEDDAELDVMEAADEDVPQKDRLLDAAEETQPGEEEKIEVSTLETDTQQVVESIQVTWSQQQKVTVDPEPEQEPKDVVVQNKQVISLLDSSEEEEDDEDEEREVSEEEEEVESRGETSNKSEAAAASVEGLFMIDTRPGQDADEHYYKDEEEEATTSKRDEQEEEDEEFVDEEGDDDDDDEDAQILFSSRDSRLKELSSRIDPGIRVKQLGGLYISFDGSKSKPVSSSLQKLKEKKIQDEVMKRSVIGPDFEKKDAVPPYTESKQKAKLKRRAEREKTTGDSWFNMKAPELTQELKGDLQVLKMRGSMDPKRFYKKNDRDGFPKYFQVGTVVDNPVDFYHSRIPKKERKRTMVEELMADAEFRHNNKKRYQHILAEKAAQGAGKRNRKKSKFHKK
ncbi:deoxynucleotidyltransferase terminal-interacting protein 2 [Amphiprion ocellaris]|uniref:Fcf2 pre-rRNA processing C-terminal domain-containing protein n=1 Tax=Amphiprion ocellaris TaxID=80972 RepID=A0A3Q1AWS2_AMPOC|nr:deoxynucleotidyltransferase terminal-interacting protein 2 [Amphiprion ocellaris]